MKEIGGYFSLELPERKNHFHMQAIQLNSARNAFEYILKHTKVNTVYIPYYNCDVMLEPLLKTFTSYKYYAINDSLEIEKLISLKDNELILYINYFGIKNQYVEKLIKRYQEKLIIDNSQAFFAKFEKHIYAIYSPRKFFGVSDGGYLVGNIEENSLEQDFSAKRMNHLIGRLDSDAEKYYDTYKKNDNSLKMQDIKKMSTTTEYILSTIDYKNIAKKRKENFMYLHDNLKMMNSLRIDEDSLSIPMIYPFLFKEELKKILIENKIYVATYWPNILEIQDIPKNEQNLTKNLIPLPLDQRYNLDDMKRIVQIIKENF
ncbi:MAG: hypothetical protein FP820_07230 [Sulfurimonas sp.]|nr:hypothetical protein [Sulfurimonas sp.]MBU3938359.1 hypothetical protein [bacterium]MBU4025068.1 hypothetical protein [bacterium]MBU4058501.1 hypothetical protein [bacterium]